MDEERRERLCELVEKAQGGGIQAYGRVVELTQRQVCTTVRGVMGDTDLVQDAVQEAYLRAFRHLGSLRQPVAFESWLLQIATNVAYNLLRSQRWTFVSADHLEAFSAGHGEGPRWDERERRALARAMINLDAEERRLCERYYLGGWSTARLARERGITGNALRKRLQRLRDRLRKEIDMQEDRIASGAPLPQGLPEKVVELLSRPILTDLPDNPVGKVWEEISGRLPGFERVELPEVITCEDLHEMLGNQALKGGYPMVHKIDEEKILRFDLTVPMLLRARQMEGDLKLMAAGKAYRTGKEEDSQHLEAFHQAEVLIVGRGQREWDLMNWITAFLDELLGNPRLRIEQVTYSTCQRGWEVSIERDGQWLEVLGWGRMDDDIVRKIGYDPQGVAAVGAGLGLERLACLRYGIDDIRKVEAVRL